MTYSTNPNLPRIRRDAVRLHTKGWSTRKIGRHLVFHHTAVMKWVKKVRVWGDVPLPTKSSRPKHHPNQLSDTLVWKIFHTRLKVLRSAEVIHQILKDERIVVSLASVKRTLDRSGLLKKHAPVERPLVTYAGALVELDTVHTMQGEKALHLHAD